MTDNQQPTRRDRLVAAGFNPADAAFYAYETSYSLTELLDWARTPGFPRGDLSSMDDIEADQYA